MPNKDKTGPNGNGPMTGRKGGNPAPRTGNGAHTNMPRGPRECRRPRTPTPRGTH